MGLLDSDDSGNESQEVDLKVNKKFAGQFEKQERFKELQRSKELLKKGIISDSDSESESEDDDAEQLSAAMDLKIIQTINSIRKKDPRIYDNTTTWFEKPAESEEEDSDDEKTDTKKKKYKDVLREQLLTHGADIEGSSAKISRKVHENTSKNMLSYDKEQEKIRQEFLKIANDGDKKKLSKQKSSKNSDVDDDSSDDDDVLTVKSKTPAELQQEEIELKAALLEMKELDQKESSSKPQLSKKTAIMSSSMDPSEDAEAFLVDYMMNQKWKDKGTLFTSSKKKRSNSSDEEDDEVLSEDEEELDKVDRFESKYNFRFEELQAEGNNNTRGGDMQVTGHARDVQGSMRRVDDKRKLAREQRQERKEKEKRKQEAELRRLKNLKRQELKERLSKIGEIAGLKKIGLDENLLDEDWDPQQHEAMMNAQFNDEYYNEDDSNFHYTDKDGNYDTAGAEYPEEGGDYTTQELLALDGYEEEEGGAEQYPDEGDDDYEMNEDEVAEVKHMVNELYQLDYEDIVAGIPCRFKYKEVEPEGFGLSSEDILLAEDSELNKFVSLKHISANTKGYAKSEVDISKKRKKLRTTMKERLAREALEAEIQGKEIKGLKKTDKKVEVVEESEVVDNDDEEAYAGTEGDGKKKRKRRKPKQTDTTTAVVAASVVQASSTEPEVKTKKQKEDVSVDVSKSVDVPSHTAVSSNKDISTTNDHNYKSNVVKVGTNKERKLKVLEEKKKRRQKLIAESKEKASVKKTMNAQTTAIATSISTVFNKGGSKSTNGTSDGIKKRLDLYK